MATHINFVCDQADCKNERGQKVYLPLFFDNLHETWNDMIVFVKTQGWKLEMNESRVIKATCPNH